MKILQGQHDAGQQDKQESKKQEDLDEDKKKEEEPQYVLEEGVTAVEAKLMLGIDSKKYSMSLFQSSLTTLLYNLAPSSSASTDNNITASKGKRKADHLIQGATKKTAAPSKEEQLKQQRKELLDKKEKTIKKVKNKDLLSFEED